LIELGKKYRPQRFGFAVLAIEFLVTPPPASPVLSLIRVDKLAQSPVSRKCVSLKLGNLIWRLAHAFPYAASIIFEATMSTKLQQIQARARELAQSGTFIGWRPIAFTLQFEEGFAEAFDWIYSYDTQEELDRLCGDARARLRANRSAA
jgi:hypothetical protein